MQQPRLVLYPQTPPQKPIQYSNLLQQLGLIGAQFELNQHPHYLVGTQFFQHIMFLGCAPFIKTELPTDLNDINFCHIELISDSAPQFFHSAMVRTPSCPQCKYAITDWQTLIAQWQRDKMPYDCPQCQHTTSVMKLNWHKKAGFAQDMINIWGIFEGEAMPSDDFLFQLKQYTQVLWHYCYATGTIYA